MTLEIREEAGGQILVVQASGTLSKDDYIHFVPETERLIKLFGKIRILFELHDFHGWELSGMWEDLKFDLKHFKDIDRLAIVGEKAWEHGMSFFCRPFTTADIQYFDRTYGEAASHWIHEGVVQLA
jgi:hypothetical protein